MESKTLAAADTDGNIYYHYMDEAASRMDKSRRAIADSDGCLSYTYTYSTTASSRIIGKVGYSDGNWTTVKVTLAFYDDANNRLRSKVTTEGGISVTYKYFNDSSNRVASKEFVTPDANGNIKYEYYNENYSGGMGRVYRTTRSDKTVFTTEGYYSGTPLSAKTYQSGTYAGYLYYFYNNYTATTYNEANVIGFRKKASDSATAHTDYKKRNGVYTKYHEEDASGNKYWYKWDAYVDPAIWPSHPGWFMVVKYSASDGQWYAYAFDPSSDRSNPDVDWDGWRHATAMSDSVQAQFQLGNWPPASVTYPTAPIMPLASQALLTDSLAVDTAPEIAAKSLNTTITTADTTTSTVTSSEQDLIDFKAGLKQSTNTTPGVTFVGTLADNALKDDDLVKLSTLASPAALQDRGAG
jgi:hypothetical protein